MYNNIYIYIYTRRIYTLCIYHVHTLNSMCVHGIYIVCICGVCIYIYICCCTCRVHVVYVLKQYYMYTVQYTILVCHEYNSCVVCRDRIILCCVYIACMLHNVCSERSAYNIYTQRSVCSVGVVGYIQYVYTNAMYVNNMYIVSTHDVCSACTVCVS